MFWHGILSDIETFVTSCETCQKFARNKAKEPLKLYPVPLYPWQQLAADIATFDEKDYLVIVHKYSNWPEVVQLSSKLVSEITRHFSNIFGRHGVPETVESDNNPFNSATFLEFAREWGFETRFTSLHFPSQMGTQTGLCRL